MAVESEKIFEGHIQWASVLRFSSAAFQHKGLLVLGLFGLALGSFAWTSTSWLSGRIADRILDLTQASQPLHTDSALATLLGGVFLAVIAMYFGNRFGRLWINRSLIEALTRVHNQAVEAVFGTFMQFFNSQPTGRIVSRFAGDYLNAGNSFDRVVATFIYSLFAMLFSATLVLFSKPMLILVSLPFCVALFLVSRVFGRRAREVQRHANRATAVAMGHFSESLAGNSLIRALQLTNHFTARMHLLQTEASALTYRTQQLANWRVFLQSLLALGLIGLSLLFSFRLVAQGELSPGEAGANVTLIMLILRNFLLLVELVNTLETGFTSVERISEFADLPPEQGVLSALRVNSPSAPQRKVIALHHLSVRYSESLPFVLNGVTQSIFEGEKIGLVGRTGSGKSTLVQALFRMVDVAPGQMFIDGSDVTTYSLRELRALFGIVPQEPVLFAGTLFENILPSASLQANVTFDVNATNRAWVEEVLARVQLLDWVRTLPYGLDTPLAERGGNLSFGQRQLLCLARALAKKPRFLILDEATSSVDANTEHSVNDAIRSATAGVTCLIIAHHLSTIEACDRIFLMADGRIIEEGRPKDLIANTQSAYSLLRNAAQSAGGVIQ